MTCGVTSCFFFSFPDALADEERYAERGAPSDIFCFDSYGNILIAPRRQLVASGERERERPPRIIARAPKSASGKLVALKQNSVISTIAS